MLLASHFNNDITLLCVSLKSWQMLVDIQRSSTLASVYLFQSVPWPAETIGISNIALGASIRGAICASGSQETDGQRGDSQSDRESREKICIRILLHSDIV